MNKNEHQQKTNRPSTLGHQVGVKATRKLKALHNAGSGVWYGLGMMGLIGWSVAIPTLLGVAIGLWLDQQKLSERSWTLALLVAGLTLGCLNAWLWVSKEQKAIRKDGEHDRG